MASNSSGVGPWLAPRDYTHQWPCGPFNRQSHDRSGQVVAERWAAIVRYIVTSREHERMTQRALADLAGLRPATLSELESGQRWPGVGTAILLVDLLHGRLVVHDPDA